jgi:FG-GAP-like repeat/FG-GAP repeat/Subtilase family
VPPVTSISRRWRSVISYSVVASVVIMTGTSVPARSVASADAPSLEGGEAHRGLLPQPTGTTSVDEEALDRDPGLRAPSASPRLRLESNGSAAPGTTRAAAPQALPAPLRRSQINRLHAWGLQGDGVRVGIIDYFDGVDWITAGLPGAAHTVCRSGGSNCDVFASGVEYGVRLADLIHTVAPGAELALGSASNYADLDFVVDSFIANDVDVIVHGLDWTLDGPGDGTGTLNSIIDGAAAANVLWVNAAGDHSDGGYWRGTWTDPDANGWLNFDGAVEVLPVLCDGDGDLWMNGIRWNDSWTSAVGRTDFDLYVYPAIYDSIDDYIAGGFARQNVTAPRELFTKEPGFSCPANTKVNIAIRRFAAGNQVAPIIEIFTLPRNRLDDITKAGSATTSGADNESAGSLTVGAIQGLTSLTISPASGRGPTTDGRHAVDIVAPDCVKTPGFTDTCTRGSTASAAIVAGAAAIIEEWAAQSGLDDQAWTPDRAAEFLRYYSVERGTSSVSDPIYGVGELHLPDVRFTNCDLTGDGRAELLAPVPWESAGATRTGALHLVNGTGTSSLVRTPGSVLTQANFKNGHDRRGREENDVFGSAVACGDFDGNGQVDIAVGVPGERYRTGPPQTGEVNVGLTDAAHKPLAVTFEIYMTQPAQNQRLGAALASGDITGDGSEDLVTVMTGGDGVAPALHVWDDNASIHNRSFPTSSITAIATGDVDGDGYFDVVAAGGGRSYLAYGRRDGKLLWTENPFRPTAAGSGFGKRVVMTDLDGDGFDEVIISSPQLRVGGAANAGGVAVFWGKPDRARQFGKTVLVQGADNLPERSETGDQFGWFLATGDYDGDGFGDLAIGNPYETVGTAVGGGNVMIVPGRVTGHARGVVMTQNTAGVPDQTRRGDAFGHLWVSDVDLNGDGFDDLVVGAGLKDLGNAVDAGAVFLLRGSESGVAAAGSRMLREGSELRGTAESQDHLGYANLL